MPTDTQSPQDAVNPPTGYSLVSSKRSLKDLMAEASQRAPILPPKGYILDPDLKILKVIRQRNQKAQTTPEASIEPYAPSTLEQLRDTVANTAIGYSLEQSMPKLADALNLHPTETVNSPTYQQHKEQLLAPEYATQAVAQNLPVPLTQAGEERLEGALRGIGGLTSGSNMALMAGTAVAAGLTAGIINPVSAQYLSRAVSGGFTLDMLYGLYQKNKEYKKAIDSGNISEAHKIQGEMGVDGIMALLTAHHALTSHPFTPIDTQSTPSRERTNVLHRNEAGEVRQANGQAPTVWLSPAAWGHFMGALYPGEDAAATHGINLPANEHLHAFANDQQLGTANPQFGQVQELLAKAHEGAGQGSVAIGKNRPSIQANVNVMREELNHTWQRGLTGKITDHLSPEGFTRMYQAIPSGMYDHLMEHGYNGYNSPEMVTEAAAKLMDGRPERFGVDKDEAVDFLDKYFSEVSKQHGAKALEELQHVRGIAKDARDRAIEEHSRTGAGQDSRTVSGVGDGRQGGAGEGVSAQGEGLTPAAEGVFNREKDKPVWYLKSERLIGDKMKGPMPAEDTHKMLLAGGVKPEEMHWTGLDDFLKSKGKEKVTPEEIREHLANNNLQIKEVMKGQPKPTEWTEHRDGILTTPEGYKIELLQNGKYIANSTGGMRTAFDTLDEAKAKVDEWRKNSSEDEETPKFSSYQLPGAEPGSYRELLLTSPTLGRDATYERLVNDWRQAEKESYDYMETHRENLSAPDAEMQKIFAKTKAAGSALDNYKNQKLIESGGDFRPDKNDFTKSHWDEPNVLAHVRFNDRIGPNGEKLLHIEEAQSDWGQKIRKEGVKKSSEEWAKAPMKAIRRDGYWEVNTDDGKFVSNVQDWNSQNVKTAEDAVEEARRRAIKEPDRVGLTSKGHPDMPWKKNWHEQALRRMVRYAVDNGYQGVSWTPGDAQAERYDLSKQVGKIRYDAENGLLTAYAPDGATRVISEQDITPEKLPDYIGKEAAQKLMDQEPDETGNRDLEGDGLKVGGSGMKGFYDKIVPDYLNKFGKKYGAKVGTVDIGDKPSSEDTKLSDQHKKLVEENERAYADWQKSKQSTLEDKPMTEAERHDLIRKEIQAHGKWKQAADDDREFRTEHHEALDRVNKFKREGQKTVPYLPITPEMRKSVGEEGVPLFNREQVKTPEFRAWFEGSKVVNPDGTPKVLVHSTNDDWNVFNPDLAKRGSLGFHAGTPEQAEKVRETGGMSANVNATRPLNGMNMMPVYLKINNPLRMEDKGTWSPWELIDRLDKEHKIKPTDTPPAANEGMKIMDYPSHMSVDWERRSPARQSFDLATKKHMVDWRKDNQNSGREQYEDEQHRFEKDYVIKLMEKAGYDGIVYDNKYEGGGDSYMAFHPEQIKSALGNNGKFDPTDPNILRNREKIIKTPEFAKWFEGSKIVDDDGKPKVMYHGTNKDFSKFDPNKSFGKLGVSWFSPSSNVADGYGIGEGSNTMPVYIKANKIFDFNNEDDLSKLRDATKDTKTYDAMRGFISLGDLVPKGSDNSYYTAEHPELFKKIKNLGYDAVRVKENKGDSESSVGIFSPKQIKSALGNSGAFDPKDPNILRNREKPFNPAAPDKNTPSDDGYLYHATNDERAYDIARGGLLLHKPGEYTDQDVWPDGSTKKRNYFTPNAASAYSFQPEDGKGALLRVKRDDRFKNEQHTGDVYSHSVIPPKDLEILGEDGKWIPISQAYPKDDEPSFNREKPSAAGQTATLEPNTTEKGGADNPEPTEGSTGATPTVDNTDRHQLTHVNREDAPAEVKAWDADEAAKWTGGKPSLQILSQKDEELDPKTLKTTQPWAGAYKLKQFEGMDDSTAPPIQVVRTEDGDWIVDGVHRATRAAKDGQKVKATVYTVKIPAADRTVNIPVAGGTTIKSAPKMETVVPRTYYRGTNPESTERVTTGDKDWDSHLFAADQVKHAENYGRTIEQINLKPNAKVLVEGSKDFKKLVGNYKPGENMLSYSSRAAKLAKAAGYDLVHFQLQGTVGTAIMNRDSIESRQPYTSVKDLMFEAEKRNPNRIIP